MVSIKSTKSQSKQASVETYYERIIRQKKAIMDAHKNYSGAAKLKQLVKSVIG